MATVKDVASLADVSPSTVSIVMKGKGDARKISAATQQRVIAAAQKLNYMPNIQAQSLRGGIPAKATIMMFWAADLRLHILSRFITGLQSELLRSGYPCQIQIKPYENDRLREALTPLAMLSCNGIIICNASEADMEFLEQLENTVPIVLYNRYSKRYSTINMDDRAIGTLPAQVFARHGKKRPALFKAPATFSGMNIRTNMYAYQLNQEGLPAPVTVQTEDSMKGGCESAILLSSISPLPDCLLCTSDRIAIGALRGFHQKEIRIPEQIEMISIGTGDRDQQEYAVPSLSVIHLPIEDMAAACLKRICRHLGQFGSQADSQTLPTEYVARESCPE